MCLYVLFDVHKENKPLVAQRDITCFKVLLHNCEYGVFTPYQGIEVKFKNRKCLLKADSALSVNQYYEVTRGIHAYSTKSSALFCAGRLRDNSVHRGLYKVHKAIIPKGTKYFIGIFDDIVAEKMIVHQIGTLAWCAQDRRTW